MDSARTLEYRGFNVRVLPWLQLNDETCSSMFEIYASGEDTSLAHRGIVAGAKLEEAEAGAFNGAMRWIDEAGLIRGR
jgi:hypothetical protein